MVKVQSERITVLIEEGFHQWLAYSWKSCSKVGTVFLPLLAVAALRALRALRALLVISFCVSMSTFVESCHSNVYTPSLMHTKYSIYTVFLSFIQMLV